MLHCAAPLGSDGFGVTVANVLFASFTPACAFPARPCAAYFVKANALSFLQSRSVSNPSLPALVNQCCFFRLCIKKAAQRYIVPLYWGVMDSNHRSRRQQIYSLPHLAALETPRKNWLCQNNRQSRLPGSNRRPHDYKSSALPAELRRRDT